MPHYMGNAAHLPEESNGIGRRLTKVLRSVGMIVGNGYRMLRRWMQ